MSPHQIGDARKREQSAHAEDVERVPHSGHSVPGGNNEQRAEQSAPAEVVERLAKVLLDNLPGTAWFTLRGAEQLAAAILAAGWVSPETHAAVVAERDEAQDHIARWLDENPPLSTSERVQRGSTGDLATDMMRYAGRLKDRAERAEAEIERLRAGVAEARAEGAAAVVKAVLDAAPRLNSELLYDGREDPQAAAYVEGFKDAHEAARAAAEADPS